MITKIENQKKRVLKETYTKIHEQFCRKIQSAVALNQKQVILTVPPFLLGFPTYNLEKACVYLKRQLERSGFDVAYMSPIVLFVSWFPVAAKKQELPRYEHQEVPEQDELLPSLINLRKTANKYRA